MQLKKTVLNTCFEYARLSAAGIFPELKSEACPISDYPGKRWNNHRLKMQQPMNANPVQVVVISQPGTVDKQIKYRNMKTGLARQLVALGILQLLIGILCIIFQGVAVGIFANQRSSRYAYNIYSIDFVGHGFWCGIMFLITGPFGIAGGIRRNRCQVVAFNVLSILSASFALCLLSIAAPAAWLDTFGSRNCRYVYYTTSDNYNRYYYATSDYRCYTDGMNTTGVAMEALMAILALIEGIIAIWSSAICCTIGACCCGCGGSCCCPPSPIRNQYLMTGQPYPGQQQIIIANQQQLGFNQQPQMFIPNQPQPFLPNSQQLMFSSNQQQPIINLDPRLHVAQYIPQQPGAPPYSEQPSP